jgi:4'-phosphopantetheinyl transferase EntD
MRRALHQSGIAENCSSILKDSSGAPVLPQGILGSISHKQQVAVALVSNSCQGFIGANITIHLSTFYDEAVKAPMLSID